MDPDGKPYGRGTPRSATTKAREGNDRTKACPWTHSKGERNRPWSGRSMLIGTSFAAMSLLVTSSAVSQDDRPKDPRDPSTRVATTVAMLESQHDPSVAAIIIRRPSETPADMILLSRTAEPADLFAAVVQLTHIRKTFGERPALSARYRIRRRDSMSTSNVPSRELPALTRVLSDLRRLPAISVPGVGLASQVEIRTPREPLRSDAAPQR